MTAGGLAARPPLRMARAVVLACLATAVGGGSHLLTGGDLGTTPAEPGASFTVAENAATWPVQRDAVALDPYSGQVTESVLWRDWPVPQCSR